MTTATARIPVLVSPQEKTRIAQLAKASGISMGEFLRRAAISFQPSEDEALLVGLIDQMEKSTAEAGAAIDDALAFVEASNARIERIEAEAVRGAR
ncbi:ribbon-helix-helix protein, CopG family [Parasulfuritortus cantonensis]|uniref:Ribbon-helix-helix protein, CopG family n=2 Tax=Parasulfuritortus cantonensis TaxID=2528202 RepID=A0A4R1BR25_9PROT|nr:ribbon-helix-helix protein, CopG family [Parasulfuritortus cantonensis]